MELCHKAIYYIKILPGTTIFSDDVNLSETLESSIKRASSCFQEGDTYTTVSKDREVQTLTIPPRVSWWLTSVDNNQSQQLLSRQFGGGVDESEEHDKKVTAFQLKQAHHGTVTLPTNDAVLVCREIFRQIKQQLVAVYIPFAEYIEWIDTSDHRSLGIFLDIIKSYTVLNFKNRKTVDGMLIAHPDDYIAAKKHYDQKAETQTTKNTQAELNLLKFLNTFNGVEVNISEIQTALKISRGRVHRLLHGTKDNPDTGLLAKVPNLHFEKRSIKIGDTITPKNYYRLEGEFNLFTEYEKMVTLKQEVVDRCYRCYSAVTSVLLSDFDMPLIGVTDVIVKEEEERKTTTDTQTTLKKKKTTKKYSLSETQKNGNTGNTDSTDHEKASNTADNTGVTPLEMVTPLEILTPPTAEKASYEAKVTPKPPGVAVKVAPIVAVNLIANSAVTPKAVDSNEINCGICHLPLDGEAVEFLGINRGSVHRKCKHEFTKVRALVDCKYVSPTTYSIVQMVAGGVYEVPAIQAMEDIRLNLVAVVTA
jgi:hypothetical protein